MRKELEDLKDVDCYEKEGLSIFTGYNSYGDKEIHIYNKDKHIFEWYENANVD